MQLPQLEQPDTGLLCLYLELDGLVHVVYHHHFHGDDDDEGGLMGCRKEPFQNYPQSLGGFHTVILGYHRLHGRQRNPGPGPFATS